uniref:DUF4794 domain-containing protein n=1 Tax=Dendroctonus ponderosae TaxID=77166 RepID=A0AAR5PLJ4_DENPD
MPHRHRWPYVVLLPLWLFLPFLLALPSPTPLARTRHHEQRQLHRLAGGHLRILDSDPDDSELITASAGENVKGKKGGNADERKTLSQQVADGKYGLIQKELFKKQPKRPGIISYAPNSEVPKDNIATLGGLTKNDIWLAENHLLVIKGGAYPPHDDSKQDYISQIWQPIDDYSAPLHQVKIPKNPAVPPPFPVQLSDDGPLQILGTNSSRTLNASAETPAYALPPPPGWDGEIPPQGEYFPETGPANSDQTDPASGQVTLRVPVSGEPAGGMPFPPTLLNGSFPPSFAHLPPGAAILPAPLGNDTILDEDDPSIYYPPPYSFYYPKDNTSLATANDLELNAVTPGAEQFSIGKNHQFSKTTRKPQSNFYYYEETDPALNAITTEAPQAKPNPAYDSWNQFYSTPRRPSKAPSVKPQYIYLTGRPYEREKPKFRYIPQSQPRPKPQTTFSIHIANLQNQLSQQYFTTPDSLYRPTSKPVYQYSFEAQNYNRPGGKAFKPSQLMDSNEDGFKPIPKYSVQIQPAIEIVQTQRPNYQQIQPLNVEEPGYYSNEPQASKPQSQYLQEVQRPSGYGQSGLRYLPPQQRPTIAPDAVQVTPSRPIAEYSYESTPNPVYQGFYTKPDEGYFDENTKQYFTIFGRKLASTTTPLPLVTRPTSPRPARYRQGNYNPPISLHSDLNVNYAQPRPPINPLSEPIDNRPQVDSGSNPEIIKAIEITPPPIASRGKKEQYIHYQLPGDEGAHFYFLTPQAAERRRQAGQYFYERDARVRRDKPQQEEKSKN